MSVELLDYPKAALKMVVNTGHERAWRIKSCFKEPHTVRWLDEYIEEGDVFYDVGANVGAYSLIAAHLGAQVYAFEPEAMNYGRLVQNVGLNKLDEKIKALPLALWDRHRIETMYGSVFTCGAASHKFEQNGTQSLQQAVFTVQMDDLTMHDIPLPNIIKIDVDGYEERVVNGAVFALSSPQLKTLMVEVDYINERSAQHVLGSVRSAGLTEYHSYQHTETLTTHFFARARKG